MKIYIACPWVHKIAAAATAILVRREGHEVTSRWHDRTTDGLDPAGTDSPFDECRREAIHDVEDVFRSDAVLVLNIEKSEGKAVEQGIAIALHLPIVVVGQRSNVFQYLDNVKVVPTYEAAIQWLQTSTVADLCALSESLARSSTCGR